MRKKEREEMLDGVWHKLCRHGMPINVRNGGNMDIADYIRDILEKETQEDEPIGTEMKESGKYMSCPECRKVVGISGFYCKWCGAMLRCPTY